MPVNGGDDDVDLTRGTLIPEGAQFGWDRSHVWEVRNQHGLKRIAELLL